MKKIILLVLALLSFMAMNAQAQMSVGATAGLQLPMGDFADGFKMGIGFNISGRYMLKDNLAVGANVGFTKFGGEVDGYSASIMPITGMVEYYFSEGSMRPFVGGDVGLYNYKINIDVAGFESSASETYLGFAPTGGVLIEKSESLSFIIKGKYHIVTTEGSSSSWLGVNAGVIFKL